ncbi:DUF3696 domain-containing protein [Rhizobium sp. CB3090]|uniref:DUF3696 domain-containing protein n=1 Tax=Rhizobium sp. CB3090 TaxID=3039156 RepID=UPI0024B0EFA3|nr:DUF3696 domain-containing protein [Rhizobium sp. CB3090]WFU07880.1 DUF3696 domain-containing protein [Rhizobium sp. CB3090]
MLNAVRYKNFKRYDDTTLDLSKRLTILVGPNSSGKSSLIKGILAFKQTYGDPSDHAGFVAQGQYVDIGNFVEYAKDHDISRNTTFVFSIRTDGAVRHSLLVEEAFIEIEHANDPQTGHGRVESYSLYLPAPNSGVTIDNYADCECVIQFKRMNKTDESFRVSFTEDFYILLINKFKFIAPGTSKVDYQKISQALKLGVFQGKRDNKNGMSISPEREPLREEFFNFVFPAERFVLLPLHNQLFESLTEATYALASLREKPVRSMTLTDERRVVGPTGAHTAAVYHYMRQRSVKAGKRQARIKDDYNRLDMWLSRLKLGRDIEINNWRDLIDLRMKSNDASLASDSVVDVGVGFSQAAPILVQLAAMPDDTMLIVEQPELHLYPWSQTRLGEILCEEAHRGRKRIVLETHSEHLIHGIQLHVSNVRAGKIEGLRPEDVQIVYVSGDSSLSQITLNEYGEFVSDWPDGFFDQTLRVYRTLIENRNK